LFSKDKDPILGDSITEVHQYNREELLNIRMLEEALKATAQQHIKDALQVVEDKEQ
jgi:hypothetical protein